MRVCHAAGQFSVPHAGRLVLFPQRPLEAVPAVPRLQTSPWSQGRSSSIHSPIRCSPRAFRNAGGVSGAKPARVLLQRNVHSGGRGVGGWKERLERAQGTRKARGQGSRVGTVSGGPSRRITKSVSGHEEAPASGRGGQVAGLLEFTAGPRGPRLRGRRRAWLCVE